MGDVADDPDVEPVQPATSWAAPACGERITIAAGS
jgi:hypothetical protein